MPSILVVDDSPTMRKMIMAAARPLNATFGEAGNGLEAIEQLALQVYDVITLDLNMPDMHGLEFIKFARSHSTYRNIPIVVVSTRGDSESKKAAMEDGATIYLSKPFSPAQLVNALNDLLQKGG